MTGIRDTLQRFAVEPDQIERVRLADVLASQLEVRENDLSNRTQVAVWDGQESAAAAIDRTNEQLSNTNLLLSAAIEALAGIKSQNEAMLAAVQESTARLGKLERGQGKLERGQGRLSTKMRDSIADRADLRRLSNEQRGMIVELLDRFDSVVNTVADHERRLTGLEGRDAASREP